MAEVLRQLGERLGILAVGFAGLLVLSGARASATRVLSVGAILVTAASLIDRHNAGSACPRAMAASVVLWAGVAGACLSVLGATRSRWLMAPAIALIAWRLAKPLLPAIPLWAWLILLPVVPPLLVILVLRTGQAILTMLFGDDAASHVVAEWVLRLLGAFGRGRKRALEKPELPRDSARRFHPNQIGGRHDL